MNFDHCFPTSTELGSERELPILPKKSNGSGQRTHSLTDRQSQMQMEVNSTDDSNGYVPPKHVLMSLVRMGSFTSTWNYNNGDNEDNDIILPDSMSGDDLLVYLRKGFALATKISRLFLQINSTDTSSIGQHYDNFVLTPPRALEWKYRRCHIIEEIITYKADIICLQEVDHFEFLRRTLSTQGYAGIFEPKPDSPCLHIEDNNGPDGCAIFYQINRFRALKVEKIVLPVWSVDSNQVAISLVLQDLQTENSICVTTTHLKARSGNLMSSIRREQGRALLEFVNASSSHNATVICGDFNAEPTEPVYELLVRSSLNLASAYAFDGDEPQYTSWKIREEGEQCHTLDYIFYSKNRLQVNSILRFPADCEIGHCRFPSLKYPSDHLSLVCDITYAN